MKTKIIFVNGHMNVGGVEKSLLDFLSHLNSEKYEVFLILVEANIGEYLSVIPSHVHVETLDTAEYEGRTMSALFKAMRKSNWKIVRYKLARLCSKFIGNKAYKILKGQIFKGITFDIAIGFRPDQCSYISTYAIDAKKHFTWWHHGEFLVNKTRYLELCKDNSLVICVSEGCKAILNQVGIPLSHISVIPNMVDTVKIIAASRLFNVPYDRTEFNIVSVSRLATEKQFELIPPITSFLKANCQLKFKWHIIGDGSEKEKILKAIDEFNVSDCVVMHGNMTNPYPYIRDANLFVHPSRTESQGLAVLEALTLGVPCVVGDNIGTRGYIRNRVNGLLVAPRIEDLQLGVKEMIDNKNLYQMIKNNSTCPAQFCAKNIACAFERLISD